MLIGQETRVEVAAGTAFADLVSLAAASRAPRDELPTALADALEDVGDTEGESWLNLFGVALDAGSPYGTEQLLDALQAIDAVELRRHLLGRFAWSWCTLAGIDDIDAAAAGDRSAPRDRAPDLRLSLRPGGRSRARRAHPPPRPRAPTRARAASLRAAHRLP